MKNYRQDENLWSKRIGLVTQNRRNSDVMWWQPAKHWLASCVHVTKCLFQSSNTKCKLETCEMKVQNYEILRILKRQKGKPYSTAEHTVLEPIPLAVSLQVTWVINPAVGCHYFPRGPQLPPQPLRGLLPISLLGEQTRWVRTVCLRLLPDSFAAAIWTQALMRLSPAS